MERENNLKEFKGLDEETPKFGAGSEFNREQKEEARRKRYGIIAKKYKPEAQPWILKVGGKSGKKFRGIREGGVGENAAFYVFTHATGNNLQALFWVMNISTNAFCFSDGAIEAYPLNEWYNFQPVNRYKALSAEEAEAEFGRRKKVINYFSLMLRKRMKGDENEPENDEEEKKAKKAAAGGGGGKKDLKISDMDEWMDSDDMSSSGDDEEEGSKPKEPDSDKDDDPKGKKKKGVVKKNKKDRDVDDEAFEESDDGDEEGREMDYDSDSSADDSELEETVTKGMQSVAEEDALKKLLTSDEDSEEEEKKDENEEDKKDEEKDKKEKEGKEKDSKDKKKKKTKKKDKNGKEDDKKESSDDFSSDSSDSDNENSKSKKSKKDKDRPGSRQASASNSRSASPSIAQLESNKRKAGANMPIADFTGSDNSNSPMSTPAKKPRMDGLPSLPKNFAGVVNVNSKE